VKGIEAIRRSSANADARHAATSVWSQIKDALADDIASGRVGGDGKLDSEHQLAKRFGVNRHTVRQAIGNLVASGLVYVRQGQGTFVANRTVDYMLGRRTRFSENLSAAGFRGTHRMADATRLRAPADVARNLDLRAGALVHRIISVGEIGTHPITVGEHYFSCRRFPTLPDHFEQTGSISKALATFGVADYTRRRSIVSAQLPDEDIAHLLQLSPMRPVIYVEGINVDSASKPIEYGRAWFSGDHVQLIVEPEL
jgi:GntR family transcriptional regulator, phosphonate transport system regulatory protein